MQNEERINGLETQVRTLKRIVYGFGCLLVAGIVVGATSLQTVPEVIQAKKFEVVNDEGKVVASIHRNESGSGVVGVCNKDGKAVVVIASNVNGGMVGIIDKDGKSVGTLGANKDGGMFYINNGDGTLLMALGVSRYGGRLSLHNNKGVTGVLLDSDAYGGRIGVLNKEDMPVAGIRVSSQGSGEILTADKKGKQTSATP